MSRRDVPSFDDLVGRDVPPAERERLRNAHELLLQAGPPPELSPELEQVPWPEEALAPLGLYRERRQRQQKPWLLIATAAAAAILIGFVVGHSTSNTTSASFAVVHTVNMHGTARAPRALASIDLGKAGADGNWPMLITVTNLAPVKGGGYYALWLSRHGRRIALCGSFNTKTGAKTEVKMSAAYSLKGIDGWIVMREPPASSRSAPQLVMTSET
ncbi:MAG TPA: hypothetical protein VEH52_12080 [Gaiellaceae bacterium]|nr:hypothetical protein [Gaiellaceae bacterium]